MTHEQAGLVWMAAMAFNMGIAPREDRDQASIDELDAATRAMAQLFNFQIEEG